ncbi:hypothetical protein D3C78_1439750 [compost metagenome]
MILGINRLILRLRADCRRIEEDFGTHQRHAACGFRIPLIPADADADFAEFGIPYLESGIAGIEIKLFFIARPIRNMAFAVFA